MPTTVDDDDARWGAGKREMLRELTQGFYAGKWKHNKLRPVVGGIVAGSTSNPRVIEAAQSAISYLNRREICNGKNLQVVELVMVNYLPCSGKVNYLTIKASDNDFYEAEVYANIHLEHEVHFVRSAVHYPIVSPEILEYEHLIHQTNECDRAENDCDWFCYMRASIHIKYWGKVKIFKETGSLSEVCCSNICELVCFGDRWPH